MRRPAQLAVGADSLDPAGVHQIDPVGEPERAQGVGDQGGGPMAGVLLDRLADQGLILNIDGEGGPVEDEDGRVAPYSNFKI